MSFWVPKIESKQVFLAINPSPGGVKPYNTTPTAPRFVKPLFFLFTFCSFSSGRSLLFLNRKRNINPSNDLYLKPQTRCRLKTYMCPSLLTRS